MLKKKSSLSAKAIGQPKKRPTGFRQFILKHIDLITRLSNTIIHVSRITITRFRKTTQNSRSIMSLLKTGTITFELYLNRFVYVFLFLRRVPKTMGPVPKLKICLCRVCYYCASSFFVPFKRIICEDDRERKSGGVFS